MSIPFRLPVCSLLAHALRALRPWLLALACMPAAAQPAGEAAPAEPSFDVLEFVIEGNTVLETMLIERAVYPFLGPGRRIDDVQAAATALQQVYRAQGYGFAAVDIPPQRADTGVIRLQVTEGRIARTRVTGARYFSQGYILERVAAAAEQGVPHLPTLQAQLADVNRTADRRVEPLLRPGREPGTTEVDLAVTDRLPLHGSVTLNNQASPNTSAARLQASLSYDNLFQRDHSLALSAVLTPQNTDEVKVFTASYGVPLGRAGLESLNLSFTRSDSQVPAGVGGATLFGKGSVYGVRRSFLMALREGEFQLLTLSADYKDFTDTLEGTGTPIRYLPLGAAWLASFQSGTTDWQFGSTLSGGLRGLVNNEAQFQNKRSGGRASYALLRSEVRHARTLPWQNLRLTAAAEAQLASGPLVSNEQFVTGGAASVRGYRESEAAGDRGLRASLQVSTPDLSKWAGGGWLASWTAHAFVEGALAEIHDPLPGQDWRFRLLGTGVGLRLAGREPWPLALTLDIASPLLKRGTLGADGLRVHASASFGF